MKLPQLKFRSVYIFLLFLVLSFLFFGSALNTALLSDDWHWLYLAKNTAWNFDIFFTNYEGGNLGGSYNPLMLVIFKVFYNLFHLNSSLYHLVSIIIHAVNAFLVYLLASKLFALVNIKNRSLSLLAGILFLIWPTQVETINWLAAWPHLWVATFYLSSFLFYLVWRQKKKLKFLSLSLLLFIISLFIKEIAISLPFVILLWEIYFFLAKKKYRKQYFIIDYFVLLSVFLWMRYQATSLLFGYYGQSEFTWPIGEWLGHLFGLLSELITFSFTRTLFYKIWYVYLAALVIIGLISLLIYLSIIAYRQKWWQLSVVLTGLVILLPLAPLGLHRTSFGGERYLYLVSAFFIIWLLAVFYKIKFKKYILILLLLIILPTIIYKNIIWQNASQISERIVSSFAELEIEDDAKLISVGLPDNLSGAEVFRNNLQQALELTYPDYNNQIIHLPVYTFLNSQNKNSHLLKWRQDEMGWFAESVDGSFVVTGQTSIIVNDIYFELWNYNYQNYTANIIRLMPDDRDLHWLTYDQGKLQIK